IQSFKRWAEFGIVRSSQRCELDEIGIFQIMVSSSTAGLSEVVYDGCADLRWKSFCICLDLCDLLLKDLASADIVSHLRTVLTLNKLLINPIRGIEFLR